MHICRQIGLSPLSPEKQSRRSIEISVADGDTLLGSTPGVLPSISAASLLFASTRQLASKSRGKWEGEQGKRPERMGPRLGGRNAGAELGCWVLSVVYPQSAHSKDSAVSLRACQAHGTCQGLGSTWTDAPSLLLCTSPVRQQHQEDLKWCIQPLFSWSAQQGSLKV